MKKINSIHFGGVWIGISVIIGIAVPFLLLTMFDVFAWPLCIVGAISLIAFFIVFLIEMKQDNGKIPYYVRHLKENIPYDSQKQYAVIRSSICTGEMVAGFREKGGNGFVEVMVIHNDYEKELFMKIYDLSEVKKEY